MVYCLATEAVAIWAYTGYKIKALTLALSMHTSFYGLPSTIIFNQGSQMITASKEKVDWKKVAEGISDTFVQWEAVPVE